MADRPLTADDVLGLAFHHLNQARAALSEVRDWTTGVDVPLTDAQRAAVDALRAGAVEAKDIIDQTKGRYYAALGDE